MLDCGFDAQKGLKLLGEIKSLCNDVPIIFMTDTGSEDIAVKAYKAGAREYFRKPVNIIELIDTIKSLLNIKRIPHEKRTPFMNGDIKKTALGFTAITTDLPLNLLRSVRFIEENITEVSNLDAIAREANLSKYHFCRMFKRYTGMSPMEFVRLIKIRKSKEFLKRKDLTISLVAYKVGYNDLGNFERHFKKVTGITPRFFKESIH
jgi:AraC-like DNA-binding protein